MFLYCFQKFFENYDKMIEERFVHAGDELIALLYNEDKLHVKSSISVLSDTWKVNHFRKSLY